MKLVSSNVSHLDPSERARLALRQALDLSQALNEAAIHPRLIDEEDKDVLRLRLSKLVSAMAAMGVRL